VAIQRRSSHPVKNKQRPSRSGSPEPYNVQGLSVIFSGDRFPFNKDLLYDHCHFRTDLYLYFFDSNTFFGAHNSEINERWNAAST
jgi:hypothetical protein